MMALQETALLEMNKKQLVSLVLDYQTKCDGFFAKFNDKLAVLESDLSIAKNVNCKLYERITDLERRMNQVDQYSRRECLNVSGVPSNVTNNNLETTVLKILEKIGSPVAPENVEAIHRLKSFNNSHRVILKLSRRKDVFKVFTCKKNLKGIDLSDLNIEAGTKIYINESLSGAYKHMWNECKSLRQRGLLHSFWVYNGKINVKEKESSDIINISHINDLKKFLPDG